MKNQKSKYFEIRIKPRWKVFDGKGKGYRKENWFNRKVGIEKKSVEMKRKGDG